MKFKVKNKQKEIEYTSQIPNVEQDCFDEVGTVIKENTKREHEKKVFKDNTDANYFTVVTFNNKAQLDEFLFRANIKTEDRQFINGLDLAKSMGIEITSQSTPAPKKFNVSSKILDLT